MAGYYYRQLDREKRAVYDAMQTGMEALAPGIRVPKLTGQELSDIYLRLKLDTPLLFYVTGFQYRWMPGADHVELLPEYLFDKSKVRQHRQAVAARLDRLVRPLAGKTDREKELAIHEFILENVRYDKLKKPYSHEIIGPLTQGVGVCEGIAKTVKALCDAVGLPCIVALSEAAPERGVKYRHTWNVVTVEGQRYHLDATFAIPSSGASPGTIISTWTTGTYSGTTRPWCCPCRPVRRTRGTTTGPCPSPSRRTWKAAPGRPCGKSRRTSCSTGGAAV